MKVCDLCNGLDFDQVLDLGVQPLAENDNGKRYPLQLIRCWDCGLIQLSCIPPQEEIFSPEHPYTAGNSSERRRHFRELASEITYYASDPDDLIADIGANDGTLLQAIRNAGSRAWLLGVEPTMQARKCDDPSISMEEEFFTGETALRLEHDHGKASVITACNVLAHVPDPHDFIAGVTDLLADDGIFITENHDWNSVSRGLQIDTVYHEHLRYYTVATLSRLLTEHGLTVTDVEHIQAHGGSFRVTAMKEPIDLEKKAQDARESLRSLLSGLQGPVYGIGATTRATPLIHYAKLYQWLHCVCEVSFSDKIGKYIPGTQIPIVDEKLLTEDQPPYALLLSWHIKDDLIPKLRKMGYKGKFIIPLPEPEIIDG